MVDFNTEDLIPYSRATEVLPGRPSYQSLHRYALKGRLGVKLESALICGRRHTSKRLFVEFLERINAVINGESAPPVSHDRTPRQRRASHDRATTKLASMKV